MESPASLDRRLKALLQREQSLQGKTKRAESFTENPTLSIARTKAQLLEIRGEIKTLQAASAAIAAPASVQEPTK